MSDDPKQPPARPLIPRPDVLHPENALSETPPPLGFEDLGDDVLESMSLELEPPSSMVPTRSPALGNLELDSLAISLDPSVRQASPMPHVSPEVAQSEDELDAEDLLLDPAEAEPPTLNAGALLEMQTVRPKPLSESLGSEEFRAPPPREPFLWAESAEPPGAKRVEPSDATQPLDLFAAVKQPPAGSQLALDPNRTAASELARQGQLEAWVSRAEWFEQEARSQRDPKQQGRTLLVASEHWAMAGNPAQARLCSDQAAKLGGAAAQRQARQLAAQDRDFQSASRLLSAEAHSAGTPFARSHAAFYNAEIERLELADAPASLRHFEQGTRAHASDPRGNIARLCSQLASGAKAPSVVWPETPEFKELELATRALAILRGEARWPTAELTPELTAVAPAVAFIDAQRALQRGDRVKAARALLRLAEVEGFARSAKWLASELLAPAQATRAEAVQLLTEMLGERDEPSVRRALATRALEANDTAALQNALGKPAGGPGSATDERFAPDESSAPDELSALDQLSALDYVAIGALSGGSAAELGAELTLLGEKSKTKPWAFGVASALGAADIPRGSDDLELSTALGLGWGLGQGHAAERILTHVAAIQNAGDAPASGAHPLASLVKLEAAAQSKDLPLLTGGLLSWPGREDAESEHQAHFAAALFHEKAADRAGAESHYGQALRSRDFGEAATRALFDFIPSDRFEKLLGSLAESASSGERKSLLFLEAGLRHGSSAEKQAWISRSQTALPSLPFALHLGERFALLDDQGDAAVSWVGLSREQSEDSYEQALLLVREALYSSGDLDHARALLDLAWDYWPKDVALLELWERLNPSDAVARAESREKLAAQVADDEAAARLQLEAAWLYEQANQPLAAVRCAQAAESKQPELSKFVFERTALGTQAASVLKTAWEKQLREADPSLPGTAQRKAALCLRLSELERLAGDKALQRSFLLEALTHEPASLPSLVQLEQLQLQELTPESDGEKELLETEQRLATLLLGDDRVAHALLAARLCKEYRGWSFAYDLLKLADRGEHTLLLAERQLQAQAQRSFDDEEYYAITLRIAEKLEHPTDQAICLLRVSEAAVRLGREEEALGHLERAASLSPRHLVIQARLTELLLGRGDYPRAAHAFEALGGLASAAAHQVEAWSEAARIWLEKLDDADRAMRALQHAASLDPSNEQVFERLLTLLGAHHRDEAMATLIAVRLPHIKDPSTRAELLVQQSKAWLRVGRSQDAKSALQDALALSPEHALALGGLAELAADGGDAESSETALLQLLRLNHDAHTQANVYLRLAALYEGPLNHPERAEKSYLEVLKRRPEDAAAFRALLPLYAKLGQPQRAAQLISEKISLCKDNTERRSLQLSLVHALDEYSGDRGAAERALTEALAQWPFDRGVLLCAAAFFRKHDLEASLRNVLGRTQADVKRKLQSGLLSPDFTDALQTLATLGDDLDAAEVAAAVTHCLRGENGKLRPAGAKALARKFEEGLAPEPVSSAFRALLVQTRHMLDEAFPLEPARFDSVPIEEGELKQSFELKARAIGVPVPGLFVTQTQRRAWTVAGGPEPRVVLGADLVHQPEAIAQFVVWRSLKLIQARAAVFARLEGEELNAVVHGFLSCFVHTDPLKVGNAALFDAMRERVLPFAPRDLDDDIPVLAMEVASAVLGNGQALGLAVRKWANRSALLATGDLPAALSALAIAHGLQGLSSDPGQRLGWIAGNQETRDLIGVCANEGFLRAYRDSSVAS